MLSLGRGCVATFLSVGHACIAAVQKKPRDQYELFFVAHSYARLLKTSISFFKVVFLEIF